MFIDKFQRESRPEEDVEARMNFGFADN